MNKDWLLIGGIVAFFLWRKQAVTQAVSTGTAGNPSWSPTPTPVVSSAGNDGVPAIYDSPIFRPIASVPSPTGTQS